MVGIHKCIHNTPSLALGLGFGVWGGVQTHLGCHCLLVDKPPSKEAPTVRYGAVGVGAHSALRCGLGLVAHEPEAAVGGGPLQEASPSALVLCLPGEEVAAVTPPHAALALGPGHPRCTAARLHSAVRRPRDRWDRAGRGKPSRGASSSSSSGGVRARRGGGLVARAGPGVPDTAFRAGVPAGARGTPVLGLDSLRLLVVLVVLLLVLGAGTSSV